LLINNGAAAKAAAAVKKVKGTSPQKLKLRKNKGWRTAQR